jgi:hypothetical protein
MAAENPPAASTDTADPAGRPGRSMPAAAAKTRPARASALRLAWLGPQPGRKVLVGGIVVAYAWVASASAPFSTRALIGVLIPGALLGAIAYGRPPERIAPPESIDVGGFSYWIVALALLFEWEASAFRAGATWWHPTLTDLVNPLLTPHPVRSAAFVIWLAAGWGLVKR